MRQGFLYFLLVTVACAHVPEREAVREGCPPQLISCRDESHGCYLPLGLIPGAVDSSCAARDAWSSFLASLQAENLWLTAASRPDTIRCSWAGPFGSETWALIHLARIEQGASGVLRRGDGDGMTSRGQVRLDQEAWTDRLEKAANALAEVKPVRDFDLIGHSGTAHLLLEVVADGQYSALALSIPEEQRSGQPLISLCSSFPDTAAILEEVRSAPLVPSRPRTRPTPTGAELRGYRVVF